ncbi:hypothetical protein [Hydrogenimonas sp.]
MTKQYNFKTLPGIDTLHYFIESNREYDNLYLEILDQIESAKGLFEKNEILFQPKDVTITIKENPYNYLGKSEGFHWMTDTNNFFKIGFKDPKTNQGLHDIRVQFLGNGIYSIGIKSLMEYVDSEISAYITGYKPITRADLNIFVQENLSWIRQKHFVTRKRQGTTHYKEINNRRSMQTLYIGNKPFMLRLYDKREEMKHSNKKEVMREYFLNHGFDLSEPIFNVEFEMHRQYLRQYNILTVDDLLTNAEALFKECMEAIRMIDPETVKESNRYLAKTHPLWEYLKKSYTIKAFMQRALPLQRIRRKEYRYTEEAFIDDHIKIAKKAKLFNIPISESYYQGIYHLITHASLKKPKYTLQKDHDYTTVEIIDKEGNTKRLRLLKDGALVEPVNTFSVKRMNDLDLIRYLQSLEYLLRHNQKDDPALPDKYKIAYDEAARRGLEEKIPF